MIDFFSRIIAPLSVDEFFETYHERDFLHVKRNDENYYTNVLTSKEISNYLDRQDIFYPSVRIVKNGKEVPNAEYTMRQVAIGHHKKDGIVNTEKAFALFNNGSTLVVQAGQRYFDNLSKCCLALSQKFNSPVQANLYITPDRSVGFNPHWDTHDVFVLQISGTKTWKLYGFEKELPTKNQKFVSAGYNKEPLQTLQLFPGDFLFLPRGYVHDAMADDGISAHVTIGILSYTWARLFNEVFPQLEELKGFREAVPFWKGDLSELIQQKVTLLKESLAGLDFEQGVTRLNNNYERMQPQPINGYFKSLLNVKNLSEHTGLSVNEGVILKSTESEDGVSLHLLGKTIAMPPHFKSVIDFILDKKKFTVGELPVNGNGEAKAGILNKLIREGVLHIEDI